jgi:hypothetical protein
VSWGATEIVCTGLFAISSVGARRSPSRPWAGSLVLQPDGLLVAAGLSSNQADCDSVLGPMGGGPSGAGSSALAGNRAEIPVRRMEKAASC